MSNHGRRFFRTREAVVFLLAQGMLLSGCEQAEPTGVSHESDDTGSLPDEVDLTEFVVVLEDGDAVDLSVELVVAAQVVDANSDVTLDWAELVLTDLGMPTDQDSVARVELMQFASLTTNDVLRGLVDGSLSQRDITITVRCLSKTTRCSLSEFTFQAGHGVDVPALFVEDSGTWLASLYLEVGEPPAARLVMEPSDSSQVAEAHFEDDSSELNVDGPPDPVNPVPVPEEGGLSVDWSGLHTNSFGLPLSLPHLDEIVLARVPDNVPLEFVVLRLADVAEEVWSVGVAGRTSISLAELQNADPAGAAFEAFEEGSDGSRWVLALYAHNSPVQALQLLVELEPG